MGYPTAYRKEAVTRGYVEGKAFEIPRPGNAGPAAVNDNIPNAVNDNLPDKPNPGRPAPGRPTVPQGVTRVVGRAKPAVQVLGKLGGVAARGLGPIGWLITGYELWKLINDKGNQGKLVNYGPFIAHRDCGNNLPETHWFSAENQFNPFPTSLCVTNQGGSGLVGIGAPLPANTGRFRTGYITHYFQGAPRFTVVRSWYRPGGSQEWRVLVRTLPQMPRPFPVVDPWHLPISQPIQVPVPLPWPLVRHQVDHKPMVREAGNDAPTAGPKIAGTTVRAGPKRMPPGERVKERKGRARDNPIINAAMNAVYFTTEALDIINAIHEALPKQYQTKAEFRGGRWWNPTPQDKINDIYKNYEHLDLSAMMVNLAMNQVGDMVLGRANAKVDRLLNDTPIGRITRGTAF